MTSTDVISVQIIINNPDLSTTLGTPMGACVKDNLSSIHDKNTKIILKPGLRKSMLGDEDMEIIPLNIEFRGDEVMIRSDESYFFDIRHCNIEISNNAFKPTIKCSSCANCNGCR
jgi:hypothetical protein